MERPNRFIAFVNYRGNRLRCHVPDPGRLKELLIPSAKLLLRFAPDQSSYKTDATVVGVYSTFSHIWVSIDSQLANRFIRNTWQSLPIIKDFTSMKSEVSFGKSRLDFRFTSNDNEICLVEVKTATLIHPEGSGIAKFPDAPTTRGTRHVKELILAKQEGFRSMIIFVVPRQDCNEVRPNKHIDPAFTEALVDASDSGVEMLAYRCLFDINGLCFDSQIPVNVN